MMTRDVPGVVEATDLRSDLSAVLNRVAFGKERVVVTRHGKALVALVPLEDMQLLEDLEDRIDLEKTRAALEEAEVHGTIPWEKVKADLGL